MADDRPQAPYIDVVFDGPPAHDMPRFIEVEDEAGRSVNIGEWLKRPNGTWALRVPLKPPAG